MADKRLAQKPKMRMSQSQYERYQEYIGRISRKAKTNRALMEDMTDLSRYDSAGGKRAIPDERQREMGVRNARMPKGPAVRIMEGYNRMQKGRRFGGKKK